MIPTLRRAGRIAAIAALALVMSACLKLDMDLEVSADDTVSGSVILGVEKILLDIAGQSFEDLIGSEAPFPEDLEGVTVEDYEDDEFAGQRFTFDAVPLSEFQGEGDEELSIVHEGDVFRVVGVLDLSSGFGTGPTGLTGFDPSQFLQGAELRVRITFPGEVTESNGEIDGNSVTWVPEVGERLEIRATASAIGGGGDSNTTTLLLIAGAVVLVLAVIVAVVLAQRRRRPAVADGPPLGDVEAPAPAGPPTPPSTAGPAAPPAAPTTPPAPSPPPPPPGTDDRL